MEGWQHLDVIGDKLYIEQEEPCWHCGKPTHWVDLDFEAPLCFGECSRAKWREYLEACRR
jgi:hypothetical protein